MYRLFFMIIYVSMFLGLMHYCSDVGSLGKSITKGLNKRSAEHSEKLRQLRERVKDCCKCSGRD